MTILSTDANPNNKTLNNSSIEEGNDDDTRDNTESELSSVLEKSSDECQVKFQNRRFFSFILRSVAIAAVIACLSYEKGKNHQGNNVANKMKDFGAKRLMLKHKDMNGTDHSHPHPKKDKNNNGTDHSHPHPKKDKDNHGPDHGPSHQKKDKEEPVSLSSSSIIPDFFKEDSLLIMDVLEGNVMNFMYGQEDILKLLAMNRTAELNNTDLTVGEKLTQRFVMLSLWGSLSNFNSSFPMDDECNWDGVDCDDGVVKEIEFARRGWNGVIPSAIAHLTKLKYIDFAENSLQGSIPEELYKLKRLEEIYLHDNELTGTLSESIEKLEDLEYLLLCRNKLNGTLPQGLEETHLEFLSLCYNQLTGSLPSLDLDDANYVDYSHNKFSGRLRSSTFEDYEDLDSLYLDFNNFRGTIPESLVTAGEGFIQQIYLSNNKFTGGIPDPSSWTKRWVTGYYKEYDWKLGKKVTYKERWQEANNKFLTLEVHNNKLDERISDRICDMSTFWEGNLVELSADCDICRCRGYSGLCEYCR